MKAIVFTDGGSRFGQGVIGVSIQNHRHEEVLAISAAIGPATCNEAEYTALIRALEACELLGMATIRACADSQLMVNQMNGLWRCSANTLLYRLRAEAGVLAGTFNDFRITHIPRCCNKRADALATMAYQKGETHE